MSFLSGKKLLLIGFIIVLLVAVPITVYLAQQQQKTRSGATAATILSLSPTTQTAAVNDIKSFDIFVDPSSTNQVNSVRAVLTYDTTKIATVDAGFKIGSWTTSDGTMFTPSLIEGPTYNNGTINFLISIGLSPQNAIQTKTKIATISFKALSPTDVGTPTQIVFANQTQVLSLGGSAEGGENVLSTTTPASLNISASANPSVTVTVTPVLTDAVEPTSAVPTDAVEPTAEPTQAPTSELTCSSLTLDPSDTGTVPFSVNLTATGNSTGSAITKVSFDFGDGQTKDVTDSGGMGTTSVSVLTSHTYQTSGTFNTRAILTDENGNVTSTGCTATINVKNAETTPQANPSPLAPTGPKGIITIGALGVVMTFVGLLLLFAL